jgi:hypothetical protein
MRSKSIPARARSIGQLPRLLYRLISEGRGPVCTRISDRVTIIEDDAWEQWLSERRQKQAGPNPIKRSAVAAE